MYKVRRRRDVSLPKRDYTSLNSLDILDIKEIKKTLEAVLDLAENSGPSDDLSTHIELRRLLL